MEIEAEINEVVELIQTEEKRTLETVYCVDIDMDALVLACNIIGKCYGAILHDGGGEIGCNPKVAVLKNKAIELLEKACVRTRHAIDTNEEESRLDRAEYLLYRNIVELRELTKEKDKTCRNWLSRVEEEYKVLWDSWDKFFGKCKPLVTLQQKSKRRAGEIYIMENLRQKLASCVLQAEAAQENLDAAYLEVAGLVNELTQTIPVNIMPSVDLQMIAEVGSSMTGIPASWLRNCFKPPLQGIGDRLFKRLAGQNHIINAISNAMLRPRLQGRGLRPIGSFLFLRGAPLGVAKFHSVFIEALVQELYDSNDLLIRFDMSDYQDLHFSCSSCVLGVRTRECNHEGHGIGDKVIEAVKKRPFCALLFENIDMAHNYAIDILLGILRGQVMDCRGNIVDFSNTLIMMTQNSGTNEFRPWLCKCLDEDLPLKETGLKQHFECEMDHECGVVPVFREAKKSFKQELLEELDDVVVFNCTDRPDWNVNARLQLREVTDTMKQQWLILYPSEAAMEIITYHSSSPQLGVEAIRTWLEENIVPVLYEMLLKVEMDEMPTIYIDALLGTDDLSYRLEKNGSHGNAMSLKYFKESLNELRTVYRKEKQCADLIYNLRRENSEFSSMATENSVHVVKKLQSIINLVDDLITCAMDIDFSCDEHELASIKSLKDEADQRLREWADERDRNGMEGLRNILYSDLEMKYHAVDVVAEASSNSHDAQHNSLHRPAKSFLFLGLTGTGKADLLKGLSELLADHETALMIHVNMEKYSEPDSLMQLIGGDFGQFMSTSLEGCDLGTRDAVETKRCRILIIDHIENAHVSVFSALLSVLDHGILRDGEGRMADFCNTIVIIMSDSANEEMLARLVGHACGGRVERGNVKQEGRRFRTELLNRVDEILIFNPFGERQMQKFARLSMRVGRHLEEGFCFLLPWSFSDLFSESDPIREEPSGVAVAHLSKGITLDSCNVVKKQ